MDNRISLVDALRGYALLGLFLVHCVERFEVFWLAPQFDAWHEWVFNLFSGKAFAIFALLFGFGFATIMANERARGTDFTWRFVWRLVLLLAFGTVHVVFYRGDILQVLAIAGLILVPFDRLRSDRVLLILAALAFLQLPLLLRWWAAGQGQAWALAQPLYFTWGSLQTLAEGSFGAVVLDNLGAGSVNKWSFYLETGRVMAIVGLFLTGMVIQRRGWFGEARQHARLWFGVLVGSAVVWYLLLRLEPMALPPGPDEGGVAMVRQSAEWAIDQWSALAAMGFQVAAFVLLWLTPLRKLLGWFAAPGRMTLTLYVGQSLVFAPILYGYGFGLWNKLTNAEMVLWGIAAFALQMAGAALWYRYFRYGPLEWLWRAGTRTTLDIPFKKAG